ncbi:MAG: hypothetical protein HC908_16890 [Calothrix sp. SM1_7_51]|nr:hypothetical protein [Calothrix sp. SM1_7_51]
MPRKDGSVLILDPGTFEAFRCQAPHGAYVFSIKLLPNPKNLSLQAFAKSTYVKLVLVSNQIISLGDYYLGDYYEVSESTMRTGISKIRAFLNFD